jgi:hypothetical protein
MRLILNPAVLTIPYNSAMLAAAGGGGLKWTFC